MFEKYKRFYSAVKLLEKLKNIVKRIGKAALRNILTLFVMLKSADVPLHAKLAIIAVLGYLICPLDLIPDFIPGGLADDLAAVAVLLAEMKIYQNDKVKSDVDKLMKQFE